MTSKKTLPVSDDRLAEIRRVADQGPGKFSFPEDLKPLLALIDQQRSLLEIPARESGEVGIHLPGCTPIADENLVTVFQGGRPLQGTLNDYWSAPGGEGPLAPDWADKPHRLLYDLIAANVLAVRTISALREAIINYETSPQPVRDIFDWNSDHGTPPANCPTTASEQSQQWAAFQKAERRDEMRALVRLTPLLDRDDSRQHIQQPEAASRRVTESE
jgi:hypothetical protein